MTQRRRDNPDRNYLKGPAGDAINVVLPAAGYNFKRLLAWLRRYLRGWLAVMLGCVEASLPPASALRAA